MLVEFAIRKEICLQSILGLSMYLLLCAFDAIYDTSQISCCTRSRYRHLKGTLVIVRTEWMSFPVGLSHLRINQFTLKRQAIGPCYSYLQDRRMAVRLLESLRVCKYNDPQSATSTGLSRVGFSLLTTYSFIC